MAGIHSIAVKPSIQGGSNMIIFAEETNIEKRKNKNQKYDFISQTLLAELISDGRQGSQFWGTDKCRKCLNELARLPFSSRKNLPLWVSPREPVFTLLAVLKCTRSTTDGRLQTQAKRRNLGKVGC